MCVCSFMCARTCVYVSIYVDLLFAISSHARAYSAKKRSKKKKVLEVVLAQFC